MNEVDPIESGQAELGTTQETAEQPAAPASPAPASPAPTIEQLFEVKYGGQARKVSLQELQNGYQRQQDYTQKTMALAEERRQYETRYTAERQQIREFLSKAENVQQLLSYLQTQGQAQPQQAGQPGQPQALTLQHLQAALAAERARSTQEQAQWQQKQELAQMEQSYKADIQKHITSIVDQNPILKSIHRIDLVLRQAAAEGDPATLEDAKQLMAQKAAEQVDAIKAHFTEQQKQSVIQKQKLTNGIEPPGGAAPLPQSKPVGKMGSAEFNTDVAEYLRQLGGGKV